jgi:hypothetical protein
MGVLRGLCPFKRGLGVSPSFKFPLPDRKGARGMVKKGFSDILTG